MPSGTLVKIKHGVFQGVLARFYPLKEPFSEDVKLPVLAEKVLPQINHVWIGKPHDKVKGAYVVEFRSFLKVPERGDYRLFVVANNGIRLWLNEKLLLTSWVDAATRRLDTNSVNLDRGYYRVRLLHYCRHSFSEVRLGWIKPGGLEEYITAENLFFSIGEQVFINLPDNYMVRAVVVENGVREKLCMSLNSICIIELPYGEQPLKALISIYDEKRRLIFRSTKPVELWGGDVLVYGYT